MAEPRDLPGAIPGRPRRRMLTDRQLTVSFLARQLLLERRSMSAADAVRRLVALQAQYSPSPYVALQARLDGFVPRDLEAALRRGTVVKASLLRGTLHLVHAADHPAMASAWLVQSATDQRGRNRAAAPMEDELVARIRAFTAEPRTTDEIRDQVVAWSEGTIALDHALDYARGLVPMVHLPPSGFWRQHGKFSLVAVPGPWPDAAEATVEVIRRYLTAFGPATREDIAAFTWFRYRQIDPALATLEPLRRFTDAEGRDLLDLPRMPMPDEQRTLPTRFLAKWDAALISHRDRRRLIPTELTDVVFAPANGEVGPCYVVDGQVVGRWSHRDEGSTAVITLEPYLRGTAPPADLEPEVERLATLLAPDATTTRIDVREP